MRVIYELCCLKNPARSLGLGAGEPIHMIPISHTKEAARRVVFGGLAKKLNLSPFFRGRFDETMDELRFKDKGIYIVGGASQDSGCLGLNAILALVDETNFMGKGRGGTISASGEHYDRAQMIYTALARRVKSRYGKSGVKGMIFLISSKRSTEDFTERRIRESINDPTVFVIDYAQWSTRPEFYAEQKWYRCAVSPMGGRSRVLEENEAVPPDAKIVKFPEEFLKDFRKDPTGCFTGDTKIALLDGREVPIKDLVNKEEFWVYSYTSDGKLFPGRGYDARLTIKNAPIVEVELDNGERIRCTENHKFMLRDGTYLEAGNLSPGMSLMPLYRKFDKHGYEMVKSNVGGKWVHTHRLIAREAHLNGDDIPKGTVVHHKDFDKRNNSPYNLEPMLAEDHNELHSKLLHRSIHSPEAKKKSAETRKKKAKEDPEFRAKLIQQLEDWHKTYDGSEKHRQTASKNGKEFGFGRKDPTKAMQEARSKWGTINITKINNSEKNPCYKEENRASASERLKDRYEKTGFTTGPISQEALIKLSELAKVRFKKLANVGNHKRWKHPGPFKDCIKCHKHFNHKVVSIKSCGFEDVYDISVDTYHNFSLTAGVVVHNSLRDLAGISTDSVSPFITDRASIDAMGKPNCKHIFNTHEWNTDKEIKILWDQFMTENARKEPIPACCPHSMRHLHIDLSKNGCATGFVLGHRSSNIEVMRTKEDGTKSIEDAPVVHIDSVLRIVAPPGGEIDHESIRELVYKLAEGGLPIRSITMDQWCGVPNMQLFKQKGFKVGEQSVVRTLNPYLTLRNSLYERRIESPVYEHLKKELTELELDPDGRKVDHPKAGTKDISDGLAGVVFYLTENGKVGRPTPPSKGIVEASEFMARNNNFGGPQYLGNGDWRWPDEEKSILEKQGPEDGLSAWIVT
jgi:intein/homing endonuclease